MATNEPADIVFDGLTLSCLAIFTFEVVLCIIAKDDYFMSFFMVLDVSSTITLVLDLTLVNDLILGDEEQLSNVRGSRTAKIGARMTRIIRVMRLVRILKLYKAIYEANQAKKRRAARKANPGEDEDDWDDLDVGVRTKLNKESLVGKKLSELTTRRVICLVLTMMLLHKVVRIDPSQQLPTSATYGVDVVNQAFVQLDANPTNESLRLGYEHSVLQYLYYHNWFSQQQGCPLDLPCAAVYDSQAFWFGIVSNSEVVAAQKAEIARIRPSTVTAWVASVKEVETDVNTAWLFNYGTVPPSVEAVIGSPFSLHCNTRSGTTFRLGFSLIGKELPELGVAYPVPCPEDLRRPERIKYFANILTDETDLRAWHLAFYFDTRPFVYWESVFSLMVTAYICVSLCAASIVFAGDANRLVLHPVENMIAKVETIRDNPLAAMKVADEEFKIEEMTRAKTRKLEANKGPFQFLREIMMCKGKEGPAELMETVILEKTIIKLGSLLALGFGQAGASIIEHNMNGVDSACVDAMIEGIRVECIIGATRIRDFGTATEVLQSKVMTFVNQIAEIVHGVIDEFHGYASKNNGDFFLMIWRKTAGMDATKLSKLADMSMLAFTRILGAVHRSPVLAGYRGHPGLQQRLGKNCRVHLSSGLHYGWAIEGAVGSEFKIDASYLSPNVSIAETVERATKIYGVSILVAESVVNICSPAVAAKCRLIDRVIITGSVTPMELYVVDLDYMSLTVVPPPAMHINWTSRQRFRVRQFLEAEKNMKWHEDAKMVSLFNENPEIAAMRFRYTLEFIYVFNMGYQNYSQGEWQVAQRLLTRTRTMLGVVDGPSLALLRFMEHPYQFEAPESWHGVRELGHANSQ
mmetsp:Transcript_29578/g.83111  ORF Transcript_29578/g.83111 Transcript_29578/m.83111 type:complete len:862 (+) Transcript_29578:2-2587(+)